MGGHDGNVHGRARYIGDGYKAGVNITFLPKAKLMLMPEHTRSEHLVIQDAT